MGGTQTIDMKLGERCRDGWMTPRLPNSHKNCGLLSAYCVLEQNNVVIPLNPRSDSSGCCSWDPSLILPDVKACALSCCVVSQDNWLWGKERMEQSSQ